MRAALLTCFARFAMTLCAHPVPDEPQMLVCDDNVWCLAEDAKHLYTGHVWGVAVRDAAGVVQKRIPVGDIVSCLEVVDGTLYAGTLHGLLVINPGDSKVRRLALDMHLEGEARERSRRGEDGFSLKDVRWLAVHEQVLWASTPGSVHRIELKNPTVQRMESGDFGLNGTASSVSDFALALEDGVWVEAHGAILRLPHSADGTAGVFRTGNSEIHITGVSRDFIWGECAHGERGKRPFRIDRKSGSLTRFYFHKDAAADKNPWNGPCQLVGQTEEGHLVFEGTKGARAVLRDGLLHASLDSPAVRRFARRSEHPEFSDSPWVVDADTLEEAVLPGLADVSQDWRLARRGRLAGASNITNTKPYHFDKSAGLGYAGWSTEYLSNGLWQLLPDKGWTRLRIPEPAQSLPTDSVYSASLLGDHVWLCGPGGVAVVDARGQVTARHTVQNGLPTNRVFQAAALPGGLTAVACDGSTDHHDGSLAVFDVSSGRFTPQYFESAREPGDGRLLGLGTTGGVFVLVFSDSNDFSDQDERTLRGITWEPTTKAFRRATAEETAAAAASRPAILAKMEVPLLGGPATFRFEHGGRTWTGGVRGVFVGRGAGLEAPPLAWVEYPARKTASEIWREDPRLVQVRTAEDALRTAWLEDANPQLRTLAMAYVTQVSEAQLSKALGDVDNDMREATLWRIIHYAPPGAAALLRRALDDPHGPVSQHAALALLERGERPPAQYLLAAAFAGDHALTNHRLPVDRAWRTRTAGDFWRALAPLVDEEVLVFVQDFCSSKGRKLQDLEGMTEGAGRSSARQPVALLRLADEALQQQTTRRHPAAAVEVALDAATAAGPTILPLLHPWLRDPDHLRRVFAATVCGRIADSASREPLLVALQKDDGLALGPVTRALGELRAPAALPALKALYFEVIQEMGYDQLLYGSSPPVWVRDAELRKKHTAHRRCTLGDLPAGSAPVFAHEITMAVGRIGPEHSQPFFREIYKAPGDVTATKAVATYLRPDPEPGRAENIRILQVLTGMSSPAPFEAAVSLLHFGRRDGVEVITHHLSDAQYRMQTEKKLKLLQEVPQAQRAFLNPRLQELKRQARSESELRLLDTLLAP